MRIIIAALLLFILQIYLTFRGVHHFSKYWSPLILFFVSAGIAVLYFRRLLAQAARQGGDRLLPLRWLPAVLWVLGGVLTIVLAYEELRKLWVEFPNPAQFSDVLPQLEAQYQRFSRGEMPYAPVPLPTHMPYPVYMPLHWLPVGLSGWLGIDPRWAGFGLLAMAAGIYGYWVGRQNAPTWARIAALFLPSMGLWGFILWGRLELAVSFEIVIAAYYLVLAAGLLGRHIPTIVLGLILCLLSRYTLLFWIPLPAYIWWKELLPQTNYRIWGAVGLSVLLLYIFPFYLQDPDIFTTGIKYHNDGAIAQWKGFGDPPVSWTMERGIYFGINMKAVFPGDAAQQVFLARALQGALMLALLGFGVWAYRRWKERLSPYALCLGMLYAIVGCFYFFSPMTFQYYLLVMMVLGAVVVAGIMLTSINVK